MSNDEAAALREFVASRYQHLSVYHGSCLSGLRTFGQPETRYGRIGRDREILQHFPIPSVPGNCWMKSSALAALAAALASTGLGGLPKRVIIMNGPLCGQAFEAPCQTCPMMLA